MKPFGERLPKNKLVFMSGYVLLTIVLLERKVPRNKQKKEEEGEEEEGKEEEEKRTRRRRKRIMKNPTIRINGLAQQFVA